MDTRAGLLIGGGTAASIALAVTCTLMLGNAAALSDQPGHALLQSSVTVPAPAATAPAAPQQSAPAPVTTPVAVPPPAAAPVVQTRPVAPVAAPPAQTVTAPQPADANAEARAVGEMRARLRAEAQHAEGWWRHVARRHRSTPPGLANTPAPWAGHRSGPWHPRAGTGSHGK